MTCEQQMIRGDSRDEVEAECLRLRAEGWYLEEIREIMIVSRREPDTEEHVVREFAALATRPRARLGPT